MAIAPILCQAKTNAKVGEQIFSFFTRVNRRDTIEMGVLPSLFLFVSAFSPYHSNRYGTERVDQESTWNEQTFTVWQKDFRSRQIPWR